MRYRFGWVLTLVFISACGLAPAGLLPPTLESIPTVPALVSPIPRPTQPPPLPTLIPTWTPYAPKAHAPEIPGEALPTPTSSSGFFAGALSYGPTNFPENINPLTGLEVEDVGRLDRRPVAVKISNYPRDARPQFGLGQADLLYEYYLENGITRFVGIFYGEDAEKVGPVRSGRYFDEHLVRMYNALLVFNSADDRVLDTWRDSDILPYLITEQTGNCPPVCRDTAKGGYNNLYVDTFLTGHYAAAVGIDSQRFPQEGMRFQPLAPWGGEAADELLVYYSGVIHGRWNYDPASGQYLRSQETKAIANGKMTFAPLVDGGTGEQLGVENVVVIFVSHEFIVYKGNTQMFDIKLDREGEAYVFRDGMGYPAHWSRANIDTPLVFTRPEGSTFPLKPGVTFIEVIGLTSDYTTGEEGWEFRFGIP